MLGREWLAVGVRRDERQRVAQERDRNVRRVALLGVRDDVVRGRQRFHERLDGAPVDALERDVEATPARDAVDVLRVRRPRERIQLVPGQPQWVLHLSFDEEVPGCEVGRRDRAGVQNGPLFGQVLPGRKPRRVVARVDDLSLRPAPEHGCNTSPMPGTAARIGKRPRGFVGVVGPDAASYLQRMLSNDVEVLGLDESCDALLLTAKGRIVAPMTVYRRGADDFLLLTEPDLAERLRATLTRGRFAAKVTVELEEHASALVVGRETPAGGIANRELGVAAYEVIDEELPAWREIDEHELELLRIRAATPRYGRELDDRVLPAEAGLDARAIDFEKGCYPGQEPIARQHYRGRVNRTLRVLEVEGEDVPAYDSELTLNGKVVGRITSAVVEGDHVVGLGYVRAEVPLDATLDLEGREVRPARFELATSASEGQRSIP